MFCKKCGAQIDDNSIFCAKCGCNLVEGTPAIPANNNSIEVNQPTNTTKKKKRDRLSNWALILSIISALLPVGVCLDAIGALDDSTYTFMGLVGFLFIIPAFIVSTIATIIAIVKYKKTHEKCRGFNKRMTASCLSTVLPVIVLIIFLIIGKSVNYSKAMDLYNAKDYDEAYESFSSLEDYKDSAEMAKECRYMMAVDLAKSKEWNEARKIFEELAPENYKSSRALYTYCDLWVNAELRVTSVENSLVSQLKNPSSYIATSKKWSYAMTERGESAVNVDLTIYITYSATNSFGGRVTDVYSANKQYVYSNPYGFTVDELRNILNSTVHLIVTDCSKVLNSDKNTSNNDANDNGKTEETTASPTPEQSEEKSYKMCLTENNIGTALYVNGQMSSYYYATSEIFEEGMTVQTETVTGGCYLYFMNGNTKTYLSIVQLGEHVSATFDTTPKSVFTYDSMLETYVTKVSGEGYFYGSMRQYSFDNIAPCKLSNYSDYFIAEFLER